MKCGPQLFCVLCTCLNTRIFGSSLEGNKTPARTKSPKRPHRYYFLLAWVQDPTALWGLVAQYLSGLSVGSPWQHATQASYCYTSLFTVSQYLFNTMTAHRRHYNTLLNNRQNKISFKILKGHPIKVLIDATTWMSSENIMLRKARHKGHILYDSIYMKCSEQANQQKWQTSDCQGLEEGGMGNNCFLGWWQCSKIW